MTYIKKHKHLNVNNFRSNVYNSFYYMKDNGYMLYKTLSYHLTPWCNIWSLVSHADREDTVVCYRTVISRLYLDFVLYRMAICREYLDFLWVRMAISRAYLCFLIWEKLNSLDKNILTHPKNSVDFFGYFSWKILE